MDGPYHAGERELQGRAGVLEEADAVGRIIGSRVIPAAARFVGRQRFAVLSSVAPDGAVWASLLGGGPGFIRAVDDQLLHFAARPPDGDPLLENVAAHPELGALVLDPLTRQRLRFNGRAALTGDGLFLLVNQAYGNCPKYIQRRALEVEDAGPSPAAPPRVATHLGSAQQERIARADTFFIASFHPEGGADASHRGGLPGFVRVAGPRRLAFDDYPGNGMFNTLGNIAQYPRAGLLFVEFATGDLLQLSGRASVGADFQVEYEIASVRETPGGSRLRWRLVEYSPANPPLSRPASGGITST